ncbi:S8 family serine peptidase [Azospirillum brasilense]|uniref:leucine-rich repeat domain-containing protein n=1 Tax=Azospirillum argentinense TaxID=2970906 RepID=UPI00190BE6E7|nr:leucine-rich repeat domain-containing protein [Azospirillum argentinense]MBK3800579.1 S8 family serine peptidase [Azospirillum argentinense]
MSIPETPASETPFNPLTLPEVQEALLDGKPVPKQFQDDVRDLSPLAGRMDFWRLDLSGTQVADLSPLSGMVGLQRLNLAGTKIRDISPLARLIGLQRLSLSGTGVTDLSALSGLSGLRWLNLRKTKVADASPLFDLIGLTWLNLRTTNVLDVAALSGLSKLRTLSISGPRLKDVSGLEGLATLKELYLVGRKVTDVSSLSALQALQVLTLNGKSVADISSLSNLRRLQKVDLRNTSVTDISALSDLRDVHTLNLAGTRVTDISALQSMHSLRVLRLRQTNVTDLTGLSGLRELRSLDLSETEVSNLSPLSTVLSLRTLDVSNTRVEGIQELSGLKELEELKISNTLVTDLSALSEAKTLMSLDISLTMVTDFSPLLGLYRLRYLYIIGLNAANLSVLERLTELRIYGVDRNAPWNGVPAAEVRAMDHEAMASSARMAPSDLSKRVKIRFEGAKDLMAALRLEVPGLTPQVISQRRGFLSLSRPAGMSVDQFQSIVHQFSRGGRAQVLPDHQHTLEAIPTFDAGAQDEAEKAEATLDDVLHWIGANAVHNRTSGRGVNIAVVDTGVKGARSEFPASKRVGGWSTQGEDPWDDDHGHGTMCACIAAATRAGGGRYQGVAPDAGLIACRTSLVDSELTDIYDLLADRAEAGEVIVATNSYGDPTPVSQDPDLLDALDRAIAAGVRFVFSAGNYHERVGGADTDCGPNSIWMHKGRGDLLTTATCDLEGRMWYYSSRGPGEHYGAANTSRKPDVTAPTPRNGLILYGQDEKVMQIGWGTSGAAPQVAGLMALLLSLRPDLPRDELFNLIRSTASPLGFSHECEGFGLIDCVAAVDRLSGGA